MVVEVLLLQVDEARTDHVKVDTTDGQESDLGVAQRDLDFPLVLLVLLLLQKNRVHVCLQLVVHTRVRRQHVPH